MITGNKTIIRPLDLADLDKMYNWYNDFEFMYWLNGSWPVNSMLKREEFEKTYYEEDHYRYAILNHDCEFIGTVGFDNVNIPARSVKVFIGIGEQDYWGLGYGGDALSHFISYLFNSWNFHRLSAETWDGNKRAQKCYEKLGFLLEGTLREAYYVNGSYQDVLLYGLLKKDFILPVSSSLP